MFFHLSVFYVVIPWPLLLAQEKGVPHLPLTAQRVKRAPSQNERRSRKRKINNWVISEQTNKHSHKKKKPTKNLQERGRLEGAGHEALRGATNAAVDLYKDFSICQERATRTPTEDKEGTRQHCPGTVAAFSGLQLLRNMWKLHAVSQLSKPGGKMAESEKLGH